MMSKEQFENNTNWKMTYEEEAVKNLVSMGFKLL